MRSRRSAFFACVATASLVIAACDQAPDPAPVNTNVACAVGILASTSGEVLQTFPLTTTDAPAPHGPAAATYVTPISDRFVLANGSEISKVFDLDRRVPLIDLPAEWGPSASPATKGVYVTPTSRGPFVFAEGIVLDDVPLRSEIRALEAAALPDTAAQTLLSSSLRRESERRYATTQFIKALPLGASHNVLYFQEDEVVTVSTDSLGSAVYRDRFSFERSLWILTLDTRSAERLLTLPDPMQEGRIPFADITSDGRNMVYEDGGSTYHVDMREGTVEMIKEGQIPGSGEEFAGPLLSPDGEFVLGLPYSCPQSYMAENLQTGAEWFVLEANQCGRNTATFSPDGKWIYFSDIRRDDIGVWRVPRTNRIPGHSTDVQDGADLVVRLTEGLEVQTRPWGSSLSNPVFLDDNTFAVLHTYEGGSDECR